MGCGKGPRVDASCSNQPNHAKLCGICAAADSELWFNIFYT
uniref:Uncharacterized protein n=1 Tax=Anopheles arabiensis TaxID=7173 RepID=A0A182IG79_ANOAR